MMNTIIYASKNGYIGMLYGKSSMIIQDKDGVEVFHTGFRKANTYDELVEQVERYPDFLKLLKNLHNDEEFDEDCDIWENL